MDIAIIFYLSTTAGDKRVFHDVFIHHQRALALDLIRLLLLGDVPGTVVMAQYVTIRVLDVKSKDNTHFKLRLDQKLGVMFREYSRRRDNLAYSFLLDGDVIDAEHTARLLVLRDQDVIVAEEKPGRVRYGSLCGNQILGAARMAWRSALSTRRCPGHRVCSMAWRFTKVPA